MFRMKVLGCLYVKVNGTGMVRDEPKITYSIPLQQAEKKTQIIGRASLSTIV
jgi:hypothetical protein